MVCFNKRSWLLKARKKYFFFPSSFVFTMISMQFKHSETKTCHGIVHFSEVTLCGFFESMFFFFEGGGVKQEKHNLHVTTRTAIGLPPTPSTPVFFVFSFLHYSDITLCRTHTQTHTWLCKDAIYKHLML